MTKKIITQNVKGHYRKLKSGKRVHVKPHTRKVEIDIVPYWEAKAHFDELPEKRQKADKARKAKKTVAKSRIPLSYVKRSGTSKIDVKDLDTPPVKKKSTKRTSVRGYRRKLKSGKTIFVKSHKRK